LFHSEDLANNEEFIRSRDDDVILIENDKSNMPVVIVDTEDLEDKLGCETM
jgi:hypothetical protein